jgi:hypothetical protein
MGFPLMKEFELFMVNNGKIRFDYGKRTGLVLDHFVMNNLSYIIIFPLF